MHKVWSLTDAMCSQVRSQLSSSNISAALNVGSHEFLEKSYREYMQSELRLVRCSWYLLTSVLLNDILAHEQLACHTCHWRLPRHLSSIY